METKKQQMSEGLSRRQIVKQIAGGVSAIAAYNLLPSKWNTPIIEQIFLPVHAATSGTVIKDPCEVTRISGYQDSDQVRVNISGFVTPPVAGLPTTIVAVGSPDSTATATLTTSTGEDGSFGGIAILNTSTGISKVSVTTTVEGAEGSASCSVDIPPRPASTTTAAPTMAPPVTTAGPTGAPTTPGPTGMPLP